MAKKQKSFADKASGSKDKDAVFVKYVKSVQSEITGRWRFNEQMVKTYKGEQLDTALKRMDEVANLVDIDLSAFDKKEKISSENEINTENNQKAEDDIKNADESVVAEKE